VGDFVGVPPLLPQGPDPLEMWRNAYSQPSASINDGKVQSLAQTYQADPEYVRDNLIDFQSRFAAQQLYSDTFKNKYPTLSRNLVTSQFVSRVRDDMGNLIETEGWWNEIANGYQIARDTVEVGNFSTRAMLEGRDLYPYERRKIEQRSRLQRAHMQSEPGFLASAAELAGTMQETLAYSLGAGYVAGAVSGPAAPVVAPLAAGITAFATSFNLEAGNLYADLVTEGYTPAQARDIAMSYGAVISGFEAVGLKLAGQPIKQLGRELIKKRGRDLLRRETAGRVTGKIFQDYAVSVLGEATTEGVQEVIGEFGKARASQIYRPQNLYEPEYLETFGQAFVHTLKGMVVLGGVPSAIRLANDNVKVATANYDYEKAKEAAEIRGRSNARDAQRQVDAESGETTTLNSSYYIRAQDFKSALSEAVEKGAVTEQQVRDTIEANRPGLMARIDEAAERDGDVELSKTEWEDAFDNTKFRDTALRHVAYEENGLTNFEVKESEAIRDRIIQERGDKAEQELQDMEEFERQLRDVRQDVTKQLREEMKSMDAAQTLTASAYSSMIIGFIRRAALQQNITPQEFYQKHFPRIVQQRLEGRQVKPDTYASFDQPSDYTFTESDYTPENVAWAKEKFGDRVAPNGKPVYQNFVRWFGDSKVVTIKEFDSEYKLVIDPKGVPIPVYHGTPNPGFDTFDPAKMGTGPHAGYDTGPGRGFFFSSDPEIVSRYTSDYDDRGFRQGGTYPVYLSMQNPLVVTSGVVSADAGDQDILREFIDEARSKGHDGVIYKIEEEAITNPADLSAEELESLSKQIGVADPLKAQSTRPLYIVFNSNQIKSTQNEGDFSADPGILYSKEGDQKRVLGQAEVEGGNAIKKILLDPNAKPTTLMHELMHWNMEIMATVGLDIESKLAQEGYEATALEAQMLDDVKRLLKWSGFKGTLAEWRAMTIDQRREFHEAIAVSFERYLYEGVAPSRELRGAFRRLLDYMRGKFEDLVLGYQRDYEREFGRELPGMNNEVRAIFGRMMSAERDVQAFFDESELDAMLMTREEWVNSGRSAEEYDEYEQEFKDSMYESKAELTQRRMKEVGTFTNAINLVAQKQRGELKRIRAQIRQEEEAAIRLQPVYQLRSWMRNQTYQTSSGLFEDSQEYTSRKLNTAMVEAVSPDLAKRLKARKMVNKDGMSLDSLRTMFGFESNEAMLQALADSRNLADEITHRTDQRLLNEHTDLMDPVVQQENIHAAVHNKIREKVMQRELKYLLNNGRSNRAEMQAMADAATQIIESTPTGDVDIAAYSRAAARARKKMLKALKDGDMEAAKFAKRQEMLNEALVREGMKARTEVRSLVKMNKRVFNKRSDKALAEAGYDVTVVKAIRALLTRLGIGNVDFDPAQALNAFRNEDPEFFDEVSGDIDYFLRMDIAQPRVGDRRRPMEHLLVGDVRKLRSLSRRMMKRAKDKMSAKIGERKENIETLRQEAQATMESNVEVKRDADDKSIFGRIRDYFSDVIRFEHLFRRIDGGKAGIWTQMFRQVKDAANKYRQELSQFLAKDKKTGKGFDFEGKIRALDLKIPGGARSLTMNLPSAGTSGRAITIGRNGKHVKTELIHLAMHYYGNSSNRRRLAGGYAGLDATPDQITQVEIEIKRFLDEQVSQGVLTRKDFAFMQSIFDHFSGQDMLGRAQKVMKDLRGYEMTEVKGEEFDIQFPGQSGPTTFAGGYIPIRFREAVSQEDKGQGVTEEDASLEQQARRMLGFLPSFTKERVTGDVDRELYLGLHQLASHAAEVYRFINMAQPIDSVSRVLSGRSLEQSFKARFGDNAYNNLQGWLKRSAFQRFERGQDSGAGSLLLRLSRNANMSIMFLNIGNTLQNYAGLLIPMRRVGKRRLISSLIHSTFNRKLSDEVAAKSPEMKARLKRQIFDIYNTQNQILTSEDSAWRRLQSWSDKYAYVLQQITQNHVDVAVWQAAYNQETEAALKENVSAEAAEARAIAHADSVVRQSQMAGEKEDLSAFESGGSLARALFPFKSWFINWLNNAATQNRLDMKQEDRSRAAAVASTYIYMLMLPAMMAQAATELARGDDFDDEDDGFGDDLIELFFRSQVDQVTGGMPVVGDFTRLAINNWLDDEYWNNRYPVAPWMRALERLVRTPLKFGEEPAGTTLDMAAQMASIMGVPASGAFRRLSLIGDEIAGELESESTYDFFRGAVTGQRSDLQRLSQ